MITAQDARKVVEETRFTREIQELENEQRSVYDKLVTAAKKGSTMISFSKLSDEMLGILRASGYTISEGDGRFTVYW